MKFKSRLITFTFLSAGYIYSAVAVAEEFEKPATFSYMPLVLLFGLLFLFRKKLIAEATPDHHASDTHDTHGSHETHEQPAESVSQATPDQTVEQSPSLNDVSVNAKQCQGTTVKGTRCSRTTSLETIEQIVNGKFYRFKTCKQHGNEMFKPFWSCFSGEK